MEKSRLMSCPFCGGDNIGIIPADIILGTQYWKIYCYDCGCTQTPVSNKEDAIENWNKRPNPWHTGTPTEDGDYIVCMSDSISTPMHVPCTVRDGKPFISMVYDTKQRTIRAYMPFKPYLR